jgi:hypothetical protein
MYAPPIKKDEYMTERVGTFVFWTSLTPFLMPNLVYKDVRNIEHKLRKMPGSIDIFPW